MMVGCPACGAEVEFRYDDSFVRVCAYCKAAVQRTDRGVESLGQFADLLPLDSPLRLFSGGRYRGIAFLLVGRTQLRHELGGVWQEWYAKFDDGRWGWLAEAQGRYYLTFAKDLPRWPQEPPAPGARWSLDGEPPFTVGERGVATYLAAAGELPFRLAPGERYVYADLDDGVDRFATLDFGQPGDPPGKPGAYVGRQVLLADLGLADGGVAEAPRPAATQGKKLACPSCDGAIELRTPDATMRVGCPYCGAMLDATDAAAGLTLLAKLAGPRLTPSIPLGRVGTLDGQRYTVTACVQRVARIAGTDYPFYEYLLHAPAIGFRWLVCSDGHWSLAVPVRVGAVDAIAAEATYAGTKFRLYQRAPLIVHKVVGECYWPVKVGEQVDSTDFVAPPAMLSCETTANELHWSLATHLPPEAVERAFGVKVTRGRGMAPNSPPRCAGVAKVGALAIGAYLAAALIVAATAANRPVLTTTVRAECGAPPVVPDAPVEPERSAGRVWFSEPFSLVGGDNVSIQVEAPVNNTWLSVGGDLVDEATGRLTMFDADVEYYSGVEGGESWSEGSPRQTVHLDAQPAGRYVLRLEFLCEGARTDSVPVDVQVRQDTFRLMHWGIGLLVLALPTLLLALSWFFGERSRWRDSDHAPSLMGASSGDDE